MHRCNARKEAVKVDIFEVNIYIETSIRGPQRKKRAAGMWLVEFITSRKIPVTRKDLLYRENITGNALPLELLGNALSILTKPCRIQVNTCCEYILNTMAEHRLAQWKGNGWVNAKGGVVANKELWQRVSGLMDGHHVGFVRSDHSYRDVMQADIKRELKRRMENV